MRTVLLTSFVIREQAIKPMEDSKRNSKIMIKLQYLRLNDKDKFIFLCNIIKVINASRILENKQLNKKKLISCLKNK